MISKGIKHCLEILRIKLNIFNKLITHNKPNYSTISNRGERLECESRILAILQKITHISL